MSTETKFWDKIADKETAIAKVYGILKPGGIFASSTTCLEDAMSWFKLIAPIGKALGFFLLVKVFKVEDLLASLTEGGFAMDYQWQPGKDKAVFIMAKKPN